MSNLFKKYVLLLIILSILLCTITGCYSNNSIDELSYAIAIGLDVGDNNVLKLSLQLSIPSGANNMGGESSQSSNSTVTTVECSSIDSGISLFNSYLNKKVNLSHCKVVVISEALANLGIHDYIYTLVNSTQVPSDANVVISKCTSSYFLENSKPLLEDLSARYYMASLNSSEYTGYTENIRLFDFFEGFTDTFQSSYAILGSVNDGIINSGDTSTLDNAYLAGDTPIDSKTSIENMGIAVFNGDTLVGELNSLETVFHLMLTSKLKSCTLSIPSPFSEGTTIDISLSLQKNTENEVTFVNNTPYITSKVKLEGNILSMNADFGNLDTDKLTQIENSANMYIEQCISNLLYKTAKEFNSDIVGFGKHAVKYFLTIDEWNSYNWLYNYKNSFFDVTVDTNIKSSYLLLDT